jgi:hypothetical protein
MAMIAVGLSLAGTSSNLPRLLPLLLWPQGDFRTPIVALLVRELRDGDHYNADHGISEATLIELYWLFPLACHLDFYLARVAEMSQRRQALQPGNTLIVAPHSGSGPAFSAPLADQEWRQWRANFSP